jgi:hypothetical protein
VINLSDHDSGVEPGAEPCGECEWCGSASGQQILSDPDYQVQTIRQQDAKVVAQ